MLHSTADVLTPQDQARYKAYYASKATLLIAINEIHGILEFEESHDAGQESIAANDQLHGLDAHSVAISRQMRLQGLQRHV